MKKRVLAIIFTSVIIMSACSDSKETDNTATNTDGEVIQQTDNSESILGKQEEKPATATDNAGDATIESGPDKENFTTKMNSAEIKEINLFLSNFSEAFYDPTSGYYNQDEAMIDFAYTHAFINYDNMTLYEGGMQGISAADVDTLLERFFGKTVPHKTPANSKYWMYSDGKFLMPAASGESYGNFTIVTNVDVMENGLYKADFNIYYDPDVGGGDIITDKSVYSLADNQAADRYELSGTGTAVLKPKKHNGEETYELVSYSVKQ